MESAEGPEKLIWADPWLTYHTFLALILMKPREALKKDFKHTHTHTGATPDFLISQSLPVASQRWVSQQLPARGGQLPSGATQRGSF